MTNLLKPLFVRTARNTKLNSLDKTWNAFSPSHTAKRKTRYMFYIHHASKRVSETCTQDLDMEIWKKRTTWTFQVQKGGKYWSESSENRTGAWTDWYGLQQGQMGDCIKHGNESSASIECQEFLVLCSWENIDFWRRTMLHGDRYLVTLLETFEV
jgi:hypothetical protein